MTQFLKLTNELINIAHIRRIYISGASFISKRSVVIDCPGLENLCCEEGTADYDKLLKLFDSHDIIQSLSPSTVAPDKQKPRLVETNQTSIHLADSARSVPKMKYTP